MGKAYNYLRQAPGASAYSARTCTLRHLIGPLVASLTPAPYCSAILQRERALGKPAVTRVHGHEVVEPDGQLRAVGGDFHDGPFAADQNLPNMRKVQTPVKIPNQSSAPR